MRNGQMIVWEVKKKGNTVICWDMISYNYKRLFCIQVPETKAEYEVTEAEIACLNTMFEAEKKKFNNN